MAEVHSLVAGAVLFGGELSMPEGDSVYRAARRVDTALAGQELVRCEFRVPRFAAVDLRGRVVRGARSYGKHLLIDIGASSYGAEPLVVQVHLKMEGKIRVHSVGERWRFPSYTARLVLASTTTEVIGTELGSLRVLSAAEAREAVAHLGPDLLAKDWNPNEAERRLCADPQRALGEALLDQRILAGIGTIYRSELCFLRGVDPRTPVGSVTDIAGLLDMARRLLVANAARNFRVTTGDSRRGRTLWVYGRVGTECLRCGRSIERYWIGGPETSMPGGSNGSLERIAYSCPHCQPTFSPT